MLRSIFGFVVRGTSIELVYAAWIRTSAAALIVWAWTVSLGNSAFFQVALILILLLLLLLGIALVVRGSIDLLRDLRGPHISEHR